MRIASIVFVAAFIAGGCMASAQENADLSKLIPAGAKVEKLATGMKFIEGPVWIDADGGYLVFSDIPASELKKWDGKTLSTFREKTHETNGNTRDREGRLISCEHATRRVTGTENDGKITVLADKGDTWRFNSPNDVIVKSDGSIWFTDPSYGLPKSEKKEMDGQYVWRIEPEPNPSVVRQAATNFDMPNGLCFSPDEKTLYVADSGKPHHIRQFSIGANNEVSGGNVFCVIDQGVPDGIRCDELGNIWSSAGDGVQIFSPDGKLIGRISVPESPANLAFGGSDGKTLFITARTTLYAIPTLVRGATRLAK